MKKQYTFTALLLAAMMLTGCGSSTSSADFAGEEEMNAAKADRADGAEASAAPEEAPAAAEAPEEAAREGEALFMDAMYAAKSAGSEEMPAEAAPDADGGEVLAPDAEPEPEPYIDNSAEPFVLTAGEWNDNENWGFFANLVHNGTIEFPSYGLNPVNRVAVTVTNGGAPAANQVVTLALGDQDANIWAAKTDQNGMAYLFYDARCAGQSMTLQTADADAVTFTAPANSAGQGGVNVPTLEFTIETGSASKQYDKTQVSFILDTTGSMGDEITYLQKDFSAIAEEVAAEGVTFSVNFYKDEGDEYVTRCNPFTDDVKEIQRALNKEYADGGGDTPEAVAEILAEVLNSGEWQDDANKIAFLIFDAPPHDGSAEAELIEAAVRQAAKKGIRVVPVVASNAERETELFGRALAIMTGANYVFLTDDSGVGDSHLEPIIGDYDVELLHDIIVRNIKEISSPD
ncbi:MAG: VWA domain-containing protein [Oscillospiraceae bacterium]|nr:VWA domain-containing protein [Oscillospiraceae bacterium]